MANSRFAAREEKEQKCDSPFHYDGEPVIVINVLIVDDHAVVREGLKRIFSSISDLVVVAEASSGQEAIEAVETREVDVMLLDISMPDISGFEVLNVLKVEYPQLPVVMLSVHTEDQYAVRALKSGACGYVSKLAAPEELIRAVRKAASGGIYISDSLAEKLATSLGSDGHEPSHESLSRRELQVLCLIGSGRSASEIAQDLSLSVQTVSTYRKRLLDKMKMKNNAQLTHYALTNGLINEGELP